MKKIVFVAIAALVATTSFSQVRFGGQVTGNFSSASMNKEELGGMTKTMRPGFGVGVVSEISLSDALSLRPSLNFLQKGVMLKGSEESPMGSVSGEMRINMNYLELPVVLAYNMQMANSKIYVGAGPSIGYGFGGKSKSEFTMSMPGFPTQTEKEEVETFKKEEDGGAGFKRLDFSANVIAGIQFNNGLFINAGGLFGLTNIGVEDSKYRNIGGQLTVGFLLNGKK